MNRKFLIFWLTIGCGAVVRLYLEAIHNSTDLHVYWKAVHLWFDGISPYIYDSSDRGSVFKYPPWTLPLFFPLGYLGFDLTRWVWVTLEILSIAYAFRWLLRAGVHPQVACGVTLAFWWIWLGHIYTGQFTLFILLAALWAVPETVSPRLQSFKDSVLSIVLASKVYSVFTLFGVFKTLIQPRTIVFFFVMIFGLNAALILVFRYHGNPISLTELHKTWLVAAQSGAAELGGNVIRGQGNHSFTAGLLRLFQVDPLDSSKDGIVALVLGFIFSGIWFHYSKALPRAEQWAGWLGVGMVIHPLLWHHSFVLSFPLCALALDRAIRARSNELIFCAGLAIFLIALFIPNIFGGRLVSPLELASSKSWGISLAALVLILCERKNGHKFI